MGVRKQGSKTVRIRPRGCSLREHPIAGSSSCATRSEGHLAREIAEGFGASAPSQPSAPSAKGEVAGRPLFSPGPVNEVSSDVPDGGQPQTFSTPKCGWTQSWGWLATTSAIWSYAENIYSLRALRLVTQLGHLTASRRTSSVSVPTVGGHGAGFLLVGMRAAPLSLPASPCAGLPSIPEASFPDATETIRGLDRARQFRNPPAYRCAKTGVYEVICRL